MSKFQIATLSLLGALLVGCGGGGGSSASSAAPAPPPPPAAPTVSVTLSAAKVRVGEAATVSWTSTNATSCTGSDGLSGTLAATGESSQKPTQGGKLKYTVTCTGAGGTATQTAMLVVPMPVLSTSHDNAKRIQLADPNLPRPTAVGVTLTATSPENWWQGGSGAFADFFQEGDYSAVVQLTAWKADTPMPRGAPDGPSVIYFLRKNAQGQWRDATSDLLSDTAGCLSPRKAVVADFNQDGRPDVFYACHGYDGSPSVANHPPYGDNQRLLLSRPDGRYDNIKLPFIGYGHGASAADLNGDGLPDLVVTNTTCKGIADYCNPNAITDGRPYVLINKGGGQFELDMTRLPQDYVFGIYGVELIDVNGSGKPDLFVGGLPESVAAGCALCSKNGVFRNNGVGYFNKSSMIEFPSFQSKSGNYYGGALDFILTEGAVYYQHETPGSNPTEMAVRRISLKDFSVTTVLERTGLFSGGEPWPVWLFPGGVGVVRSREVNCDYPIQAGSVCAFSFQTTPN